MIVDQRFRATHGVPCPWDHGCMDERPLVRIYASGNPTDGHLMRGRLEAEGISVMLKGESEGPYRLGPVYLWVPAEQEAAARSIVDAVRSGAFALEDEADVSRGSDVDPADA
jgi:hypothetical protein